MRLLDLWVKTVNGVKTEYLTAGSSILSEKKGSTWQHYLYDGSGQLHAIRYNGADYYYVRDGLMNILGLVDSSGNTVVSYSYDSWGKILGITGSMAATLGEDNPFRYKGYYYDADTGLYYIQSRYYDPEICRFISADGVSLLSASPMALTDKNLYAYCDNNSISKLDLFGTFAITTAVAINIAVSATVNVVTSWFAAKVTGQEYTITDGVVAAISGGLAAVSGIKELKMFAVIGYLGSGVYTGYTTYRNGASFVGAVAAGAVASLAAASSYSKMSAKAIGEELSIGATVFVDTVFTSEFNGMAATASKSAVEANKNRKQSSSSNSARRRYTTGFSKPTIDHKIKHRYRGIQE